MSHHISGLSPSPPDSPKSPSRTPLSRCRCSGSQAPFSYLLSFRVSAKIWRMEFPRGNSEPLQLSMRQCQAAFGQRLPSSPSRGCGAGGAGEEDREPVPGEAAARAPAQPAPAAPGFLWDPQSAAAIHPSVQRRPPGWEGAIPGGFKQPRAPEWGGPERGFTTETP